MKKALIVVGYKTVNYGSLLQAVATQKMFERHQISVDIANVELVWNTFKSKKALFYLSNFQIFYLLESKGKMIFSKIARLLNASYRSKYNKRVELFNEFIDKNLRLTRCIENYADAKELARECNFVIIGSDQVWLPSSVVTDIYTLSFAWDLKGVKTISYAPSFGVNYILSKYTKYYKKMLDNIDCLSVREEAGVNLIKSIAGKDAFLVADPVLMLNRQEWNELVPDTEIKKEKYIFVYFIGNNRKHRKRVVDFAKKKSLSTFAIIHLDEYIKADEKIYDDYYISASPYDFLNYLRHAEYVFTDSYHCFLFALLYQKKVGIFPRFSNKSKVSTNNRFESIINRLNISKGFLNDSREIDELQLIDDYESINKYIDDYRAVSDQFISEAIER